MKLRIHESCRGRFVFYVLIFLFIVGLTVVNVREEAWIAVGINALAAVFAALGVWFVYRDSELRYQLDDQKEEWV